MNGNMDFVLIFNITFFGILALGVLMGLLRGMKKSLFTFVTMAIFYVVFFVTIDAVVGALWTIESAQIGTYLGYVDGGFSGVQSMEEAVPVALNLYLGDTVDPSLLSTEVMDLANGIGMFALKLVYTILYFTVILVIYKILCGIIRMIFFSSKKDSHASKNAGFGALFGLLNGAMALFVSLIMLGGIVSIAESVTLLTGTPDATPVNFEMPHRDQLDPRFSLLGNQLLVEEEPTGNADLDEMIATMNAVVDAYNASILVQAAGAITITNDSGVGETALNLYLFDSVLSFEFSEEKVSIRNELVVFSGAAEIFMNSDYSTTQDLADLKGDEIRDVFELLSGSDFVVAAIPAGLEFAADYFDVTLPKTPEELALIDWSAELTRLGVIAGSVFDILNGAGVISGEGGLETIEVDGDAIRDLFDSMGDSELVLLACQAFVEPYLSDPENEISMVLTIPADLDWTVEFPAIGEALGAIFDDSGTFAINNLGLETIANITDASIDKIFDSRILVATISTVLASQDLGGEMLIIPDSVYDMDGYLEKEELKAMAKSAKLLLSAGTFDPAIALSLTNVQIDLLLSSAIISGTVGKLIYDMGTDVLTIPDSVKTTVLVDSTPVNVIAASEIKAAFLSLSVLGIADFDTVSFDATIIDNLESTVTPGTLDDAKLTTLFGSAILHATISKMLLDLTAGAGSFVDVPYKDVNNVAVRSTVGGVEYISVDELKNVLEAFYSLNVTNFDTVDAISLQTILDHQATLFDSAILHATISKQLFDLGSDVVTIPFYDENDVAIRVTVGDVGFQTTYLARTELEAVFDALDVLNLTDIGGFSGTVDLSILSEGTNADTLLASAILQATVSKQLLDMSGSIAVPFFAEDGTTEIRIQVGAGPEVTEYVSKAELSAVIDALDVLSLTNLETFSGTVNLATFTTGSNATVLLSSAIIQATVSEQLIGLDDDGVIEIPLRNEADSLDIRKTVGGAGQTTEYIAKAELEAIFDGLNVLGLTDLETFTGTIGLDVITNPVNTPILLSSSIIQATISKQMIDLPDDVLIVPVHKEDNSTLIRKTVSGTEYVTTTEIDALLQAFNLMGIDDLASTGLSLSSALFFDNSATLLASSSIQATLSDKMLTGTSGVLVIPDEDTSLNDIRIVQADVTYISLTELNAIITALDAMNLTDFATMSFSPATIFASDYSTILNSASMQATFSKTILDVAEDETVAPGSAVLIVPLAERENVLVNAVPTPQIKKAELIAMIDSLKLLGVTSFSANFNATAIMSMSEVNLATFLTSGSIHITIDKMLKGNTNISATIPALATGTLYSETTHPILSVVTSGELIDFIQAVQVLGGDFTSASLDANTIIGLSAPNRAIVLQSYIVRNSIQVAVAAAIPIKNIANGILADFTINAEDYESDNVALFFTYLDSVEIFKFLNDETFTD